MKKFISFLALVFLILWIQNVNALKVWIYATVWWINQAPIFEYINPISNPKLIKVLKTQDYVITVSDQELDNLSFTITADDGFLNLSSGNIKNYTNGVWYINFTYLAPSTPPAWNFSKIYVTLNDWENVVVKILNLYIY